MPLGQLDQGKGNLTGKYCFGSEYFDAGIGSPSCFLVFSYERRYVLELQCVLHGLYTTLVDIPDITVLAFSSLSFSRIGLEKKYLGYECNQRRNGLEFALLCTVFLLSSITCTEEDWQLATSVPKLPDVSCRSSVFPIVLRLLVSLGRAALAL